MKNYFSDRSSGLVIAGFGDTEVFPTMASFIIDGVINDELKWSAKGYHNISREGTEGVISPFAQREMIGRFMEGVDFGYQQYIESVVEKLLYNYGAEIINLHATGDAKQKSHLKRGLKSTIAAHIEKFSERCADFRRETYVDPIINVLVHLPKQELANMAEALVNLTSLKRKVSDEKETVGGEIDVAVISKGDGFVWVKRKRYFNPQVNPHLVSHDPPVIVGGTS